MAESFEWVIGLLRAQLSLLQERATATDHSPGFAPFGELSESDRKKADARAAEIEDAIVALSANDRQA